MSNPYGSAGRAAICSAYLRYAGSSATGGFAALSAHRTVATSAASKIGRRVRICPCRVTGAVGTVRVATDLSARDFGPATGMHDETTERETGDAALQVYLLGTV